MSTSWIRVAYGVVLGLVVLFTIGFGVNMALPGPKAPADPQITFTQLSSNNDNASSSNKLAASIDAYYGDAHAYRQKYITYQRNAFLAIAGAAALVAMVGLLLPAGVNYLRWGLLLGGAFSLAWAGYLATRVIPTPAPAVSSVLELIAAGNPKPLDFAGRFLRFALSFVSLIVLLFVGLWRLTEWSNPARPTPAASVAVPAPVAPAPTRAPESAFAPPAAPLSGERPPLASESRIEPAPVVVTEPARSVPPVEAQQWGRPQDDEERGAPNPPESRV